jgi:uncharacterized membrane protein
MHARAKLLGHPIHPMLIVFPLGLLATSLIFDIAWLATGTGRWADIAFWMITAGIIGGLLAAVFGLIDFLGIPRGTRARKIGILHGLVNFGVMVVFILGWILRSTQPAQPPDVAILLSAGGVALALLGGWLGGELVDRLGVGVDDGAHLNSPPATSGRPAHENSGRA